MIIYYNTDEHGKSWPRGSFSEYIENLVWSKQRPLTKFELQYYRKHHAPKPPQHDLIESIYKEMSPNDIDEENEEDEEP